MEKISRLLKRNHKLASINKIQEKLLIKIITDNDNAHTRNIEAIKYIDKICQSALLINAKEIDDIRKILAIVEKGSE